MAYDESYTNPLKSFNTFHSGFEICVWLICQTFPTSMFFGNCSQKFRTFTGHLWKVAKAQKFAPPSSERKSRSWACRRSNVGLPICLYPFLMQSTVLQIFIKFLNITFFPITLYSLRFMIHAKTKPNYGLSGVAFSWAFFFRFVASQPHQFCQISCANNQQVENLK